MFALACFDLTYIVCGGVNYTFRAFKAQSDVFTYLFPYLIYPMTHVAIGGTIMMTVSNRQNFFLSISLTLRLCNLAHLFLESRVHDINFSSISKHDQ